MVEFGGEADHIHMLIDAQPSMDLSVFVNNLIEYVLNQEKPAN